MTFTFEFALQAWTSKLEGLTNYSAYSWHTIVTESPAAVLPYLLRRSNDYRHAESGLVALCALVNIGAVHKDRILTGLQEFNPVGSEDFEYQILRALIDLSGPKGPYMLFDIREARRHRCGPVWCLLKQRALKRWSTVLFAVAVKKMWNHFMERLLCPDSGYFRRILVRRFYNRIT